MAANKILLVTNRIPYPLHDGGALAMDAMVSGFVEAGWDVALFSMNTSKHFTPPESLPERYRKIHLETFDINTDVKLFTTLKNFLFSKNPNHVDRFYDKDFGERLTMMIHHFEPDIIQLESVYFASYIPLIREETDLPIALRLHNVEFQIWERFANEASSFRKYYLKDLASRIKKFEIYAWSLADLLVPISEEDNRMVKSFIPNKTTVVCPFGINLSPLPAQTKNEQWVGYHLGAMDWMPNTEGIHWFLEKVWPDLHREIPNFKFFFAGRNMPGSFARYDSDHVICAGEVAHAQTFIADKKILIVPLRSGSGIRIKILEAMAAGKIVISTRVGMQGIHGAVDGKHFLLADEKQDFIEKIKWVCAHKEKATKIGHNSAELIFQHYNRQQIMQKLTTHMELLLTPKTG